MKRTLVVTLVCACFAVALSPVAAAAAEVDDERASAFVAGRAGPDESFDPMEGLVLLMLAGLAVIGCFTLVLYSITVHGRCKTGLDAIDSFLGKEEHPHV